MKKIATNGIEKRAVSGKARNCKMVCGKVSEVYDEVTKRYLPIKEFQKLYNKKGERLNIEDVNSKEIDNDENKNVETDVEMNIEDDIDPFDWYIKKIYRK